MTEKQSFKDLGLSAKTLQAINSKGFEEPTAIQALTIPLMLSEKTNVIAQAQTGTGKTAAFGLPLIEQVNPEMRKVQALILVPTRELAIQVAEEINSLKGDKPIVIVPIYGGQSIDQQIRQLKKGVHIVVGSPGRIIDHLNRKTLHLGDIDRLILDEADEMLNMGFIEDMEEIMRHTNPSKQTLLFSATMPKKIKDLANKYMDGYKHLVVKKDQLTTNLTQQIYFEVKMSDKFESLCRIIDMENEFYGMIFCRTKGDVDTVTSHLIDRGYDAESIHGDISQAQRERTLEKFKKRRINILIATDVASRGIDVSNLSHVINYSLPQDPESYVHRIGRTGRAGKEGTAITFITPSEYKKLMFIQKIAKTDIKKSKIPNVTEIIKAKRKKFHEDILLVLDKPTPHPQYHDWAKELVSKHDAQKVIEVLLAYTFEEDLNPANYNEIHDQAARGGVKEIDREGTTRLFVALGKKDKISVRSLLDLITNRVRINAKQISNIEVMDNFSFITVPFDKAEKIIDSFKGKGKKPLVTRAKHK